MRPEGQSDAAERVREALLKLPGRPLTIARWEDREASLGWNGDGIRTAVAIQPKFVKDTAELEALGELANAAPALLDAHDAHAVAVGRLERERDEAQAKALDHFNSREWAEALRKRLHDWMQSAGPAWGDDWPGRNIWEVAVEELERLRAALAEAREERDRQATLIEDLTRAREKWKTLAEEGTVREDSLMEALTVAREEGEADRAAIVLLADTRCPGYSHDATICPRCLALALPAVQRARGRREEKHGS